MSEELLSVADQWRSHLKSHQASGESIKGYCARHGLPVHRYYYWRSKLENTGESKFTEVSVNPKSRVQHSESSTALNITVTLSCGYKLEIPCSKSSVECAKELIRFLEA